MSVDEVKLTITFITIVATIVETLFMFIALNIQDLSFFNPIRNYKQWSSMNWFGVIFFTLLLNIIIPVYAFGYWFYKLCTIGRNK